ncbi:ATP-binding cassette domain-containing protein [Streptomyces palmae]|uniref:ABC-type xenobiotic transporter n=1 Tax=Streptomyces palmae TaxID=1701085 RepID=A0A4Z0H8Z1_9ACTN|nr:ATP-binding cassette domain-containing protein [Streptomyces palmae]TGB08738.1 ATP-binding cassette domain-containing protein [Streptomyces palmae]
MEYAIEAEGLSKSYGNHQALKDLTMSVPTGSILGLLGPNGCGKTTTVRCLTTLLKPDSGRARIAGLDVVEQPKEVRRRIGLAGQYAAVDERLTGLENLRLIGTLYHLGRKTVHSRVDDLLERFDLTEAAHRQVKTYSGGMRRRLDLAASLLADPAVVFLDEPTTGLDLPNRIAMWELVREQAAKGATVLLTTQYLEEADQLADRIVVLAKGEVIAEGTPDELKASVGGERLEVTVEDASRAEAVAKALTDWGVGTATVGEGGRRVSVPVDAGMEAVASAVAALKGEGSRITDFSLRKPTLDDVFLSLTGHDAGAPDAASDPGTEES